MANLLPVAFHLNQPTTVFLVYCTADVFNRLQGLYAARVTHNGMIAAQRIERAARYESRSSALGVATRLARKFNGTAWAAVTLVDMEANHG
mgnify:CR=1 FL=1